LSSIFMSGKLASVMAAQAGKFPCKDSIKCNFKAACLERA
jgi:hypothetical protein